MKTLEQLEERAWGIALGHYLTEYPEHKSPEEILELIKNESDEILFWEPFEWNNAEWVAENIVTMQRSLLDDLQWAAEVK